MNPIDERECYAFTGRPVKPLPLCLNGRIRYFVHVRITDTMVSYREHHPNALFVVAVMGGRYWGGIQILRV